MMQALRSLYIIWYREVLRFWRNKTRILGSTGRPILFLFVFGSGLSPAMSNLTAGLSAFGLGDAAFKMDFAKFIFPGIIGMNVMIGGIMSGISIVWDREFGFLKEILVAPVSRSVVALGKTLGGSTVAVIQGLLILALAPLVGVKLSLSLVLWLIPAMFLVSLSLTSLGVAIAARMKSMENFQVVMQFLVMPMFFISGALFPMRNLPPWMSLLVKGNPVTYAVDLLRQVIFRAQGIPEAALEVFPELGLGVTVFGHPMSLGDDVLVMCGFGLVMLALAIWLFTWQD